jgi:hypothetical protein
MWPSPRATINVHCAAGSVFSDSWSTLSVSGKSTKHVPCKYNLKAKLGLIQCFSQLGTHIYVVPCAYTFSHVPKLDEINKNQKSMHVHTALSHSHEPSLLYRHTGNANNFYQFFKQELKLPGFDCVISRYISKLRPHNLLRRIAITHNSVHEILWPVNRVPFLWQRCQIYFQF